MNLSLMPCFFSRIRKTFGYHCIQKDNALPNAKGDRPKTTVAYYASKSCRVISQAVIRSCSVVILSSCRDAMKIHVEEKTRN